MKRRFDEETERALGSAYGGDVPADARIILAALPDDDRTTALRRLAAVTASDGNRSAMAASLGISRQTYYDLLRKWKRHGIAGLVPRQSRAPRALGVGERYAEIAMRFLRVAPGDAKNVDIARRVLRVDDGRRRRAGERFPDDMHFARGRRTEEVEAEEQEGGSTASRGRLVTAQRGVEHARRRLARDPRYLRRAYGRAVVIDLTGTNVLIGTRADDAVLGLVCVVAERASGLVLGGAIGPMVEGASLQMQAIREAMRFLQDEICDRPLDGGASAGIAMTPAPGSHVDPGRLGHADAVTPEDLARRHYGHLLVQTIGPKVGRVVLHPRFIRGTWDADRFKLLLLEGAEAEAYWRREVLRHNLPVLEALREAGLAGEQRGASSAAMAAVLERAMAALAKGSGTKAV